MRLLLCLVACPLVCLVSVASLGCQLGQVRTRTCTGWKHNEGADVFYMRVRRRSAFKCRNSKTVTEECAADVDNGWRIMHKSVTKVNINRGGSYELTLLDMDGQKHYQQFLSVYRQSQSLAAGLSPTYRSCFTQALGKWYEAITSSSASSAFFQGGARSYRKVKATISAHTTGPFYDCRGSWVGVKVHLTEVCVDTSKVSAEHTKLLAKCLT